MYVCILYICAHHPAHNSINIVVRNYYLLCGRVLGRGEGI